MYAITWILIFVSLFATNIDAQPRTNYTSLGCFVDSYGRDIKATRTSSLRMTQELCNAFCRRGGFRYAAVQQR